MLPNFRFHHIGYAVKDIDASAKLYLEAGWEITETVIDPIQNAKIAFLTKEGMPKIEFVAPVDDKSPIVKTLEKSGISTYHICYEVDDIEQAVKDLRKQKYIKLFNPVEAVGIDNKRICYLFNAQVGLIEIVEA